MLSESYTVVTCQRGICIILIPLHARFWRRYLVSSSLERPLAERFTSCFDHARIVASAFLCCPGLHPPQPESLHCVVSFPNPYIPASRIVAAHPHLLMHRQHSLIAPTSRRHESRTRHRRSPGSQLSPVDDLRALPGNARDLGAAMWEARTVPLAKDAHGAL